MLHSRVESTVLWDMAPHRKGQPHSLADAIFVAYMGPSEAMVTAYPGMEHVTIDRSGLITKATFPDANSGAQYVIRELISEELP